MYMPLSRRIILLVRSRVKALTLTVLAIGIIQLPNLVSGDPTLLAEGFRDIFLFLCLVLPLIFASGGVSADFRSGMARLWLQKPIDPVRFYLSRFSERVPGLAGVCAPRSGCNAPGDRSAWSTRRDQPATGLPCICAHCRLRRVWLLILDSARVDAGRDRVSGGERRGPWNGRNRLAWTPVELALRCNTRSDSRR